MSLRYVIRSFQLLIISVGQKPSAEISCDFRPLLIMKKIFSFIAIAVSLNSFSQNYRSPLDIPLQLSANFGELRNNHFHSGLDFKTQQVINKPIYSVEDGFISRISVSPSGYGLALYIDHPSTGHTSVYGHIESFNSRIAAYVKEKQYEQESFKVNLYPKASELPVKKGELVAYSGNTGGSGGPHLHFEIRNTKTEEPIDPLPYYKDRIRDNTSPEIRGIAVYPIPGRGVVNGNSLPLRQSVSKLKSGSYSGLKQNIEAWGVIGLGIKAYDRMDGTGNVYGVRTISMSVDGKQIFKYDMDKFNFDETRMLNTFTDFADWRLNKSFFMKSFVEPGNRLRLYSAKDFGYLNINEERPYNISYELQDIYGNTSTYVFSVIGKKQDIQVPSGCSLVMVWNDDNRYISEPFSLIINKGNLYDDICFTLSQSASSKYFSNIFTVNRIPVPLDKSGEIRIKVNNDQLNNKSQYGIVRLNGNKESWIGGTYKDGYIIAQIRELGVQLAISADTEPPVITPFTTTRKVKGKTQRIQESRSDLIRLRVNDNLSGIASFRGTVDGKFALFEHDIKSNVYTYVFDADRITTGQTHKLVFTATDGAGNTTEYTTEFKF